MPGWLLVPYVNALPFVEALIAVWLVVGIRLRAAWILTAFVLVSLGFGLAVVKQNGTENYLLAVVACLGLYLSKYDGCSLLGCGCKK